MGCLCWMIWSQVSLDKKVNKKRMNKKWFIRMMGLLVAVSSAWGGESGRTTVDLSGAGWSLWRDKAAVWKQDHLYLRHEASGLFKRDDDPAVSNPDQPGSLKLDQLPVNAPTGGWEALDKVCEAKVSVPGTLEEYLWGKDGNPYEDKGAYFGVSWWWREFTLPADLAGPSTSLRAGKRVILKVGATRARSEIYLDGKLCGYDVVGNTPYEFDVTHFFQGGGTHRIAFRITNPGGTFNWSDNPCLRWGDTQTRINNSHAFAAISGPVTLVIVGPVSISDLWLRNTPEPRDVIPTVTVDNTSGQETRRELVVTVREAASDAVVATVKKTVTLPTGVSEAAVPVTVTDAKLWSPVTPNLYICRVGLHDGGAATDAVEKTFGFRWFDVVGVGTNAQFVLNGKRVRVLSAISWGFWPQSGLVATPEMAARQVSMAKKIGLNCLNHHRTIGDPKTMEEADKQGLFYYEEAGGCEGYEADAFAFAMNREKLLRMVKRDRSHPSTIHYNMANEPGLMRNEGQKRDMLDAHKLDPTRTITWGSGGTMGHKGHSPGKLWMKPLDMTQYDYGWRDAHNAGVSDAYIDTLYSGPGKYHDYAGDNREEIVFWGEEGPIGTPPRLQLLKDQCSQPEHRMGWDGDDWLLRYKYLDQWLKDSGMGRWFTVDSLTQSAGDKQYYYQGRMIENVMIDDSSDGYAVSGWESDKCTGSETCGLVDLWRNPKTENLELIRAYTRPLYVAVKLREKVAHVGETPVVDFWLVNEMDIKGKAELQIQIISPSKKLVALDTTKLKAACGDRCADEEKWIGEMGPKLKVSGGDRYGELLLEAVNLPAVEETGYYKVEATLYYRGEVVASGSDQVFVVDWKSAKLPDRGAVLETNGRLTKFLKTQKGVDVPAYSDALGKLDYVLVGYTVEPLPQKILGGESVTLPDGSGPGLLGEYFNGKDMKELVCRRTEKAMDFDWRKGLPDPRLPVDDCSIRWSGKLQVPEDGFYEFHITRQEKSQVNIGPKLILANSKDTDTESVWLKAGKQDFSVSYWGKVANARFLLSWGPQKQASVRQLDSLIRRARDDGTTVIFANPVLVGGHLRYNDELIQQLKEKGMLARYDNILIAGPVWLGGSYFAGAGPLFEGLPERSAFSWEYQLLANGPYLMGGRHIKRDPPAVANHMNIGLRVEGVETLVGAWTDFNADPDPKHPGTAVGAIACGKGRILFSTLEILPYLESERGAAHVVRKLLCNMIGYKADVYTTLPAKAKAYGGAAPKDGAKPPDAESWMQDSGMQQK